MLRDDNGNGDGRPGTPCNVLGERLEVCSISPMTGFFRDGCCDTGREDIGSHTVCAVMTAAFLEFSKSRGNDLSTPMPEFGFRGLKPGDRWCLCTASIRLSIRASTLQAYTHYYNENANSSLAEHTAFNGARKRCKSGQLNRAPSP